MPDFSADAVKTWLTQREPHLSSALPEALSRVETEPRIETALVALGVALDETRNNAREGLFDLLNRHRAATAFRTVLEQLGPARMLLLLDWLTAPANPQRRALITALLTPEAADASPVILSTLRDLNRHAVTHRMFGKERIDALSAVSQLLRPHFPAEAT